MSLSQTHIAQLASAFLLAAYTATASSFAFADTSEPPPGRPQTEAISRESIRPGKP